MVTVAATVCNVVACKQTNWYLWCRLVYSSNDHKPNLSKCDRGLWEPTCCRTEIPSCFSQITLNEISVRVRFQCKLPAPCSDSSDIREGWTPPPQKELEWSCSCHRYLTTSSISATWCASRRLNTPCPWVSRQRPYSSPPNNGCFENVMSLASVRTLHEPYVLQEIHHQPW